MAGTVSRKESAHVAKTSRAADRAKGGGARALIGPTLHPGPVIRMDGEAPEDVVRWTGPEAGAHTDFVLHTLLGLAREPLSKPA